MAGKWKFRGVTLENLKIMGQQLNIADQDNSDDPSLEELESTQSTTSLAPISSTSPSDVEELAQRGKILTPGYTAWSIQVAYKEGEFWEQWFLAYRPSEFPYSPSTEGTQIWYQGDPYFLVQVPGMRTLKVIALSRALPTGMANVPVDYIASVESTGSSCKKTSWKRANTLRPVVPLRECTSDQIRDYDQLTVNYIYQVAAKELPADLYERLPEGTRRCYVHFVSRKHDTGFFAKVAVTPQGLAKARIVELQPHDALMLASLIDASILNPEDAVLDIRILPVYLLPKVLRLKVTSSLSFLQTTITSGLPHNLQHLDKANTIPSEIGDLTPSQLAYIRKWAMDFPSELFDIAYIALTGDYNLDLQRVEVSVFADRLNGQRSGSVYECWLTKEQITQALPWTQEFDRHESHIRRVRATAYALAHGAKRPIAEDITEAQPRPRKDAEEEQPFMASQNIRIPTHLVQPLFDAAQDIEKKKQAGVMYTDLHQGDLITLAEQMLRKQYDERKHEGLDADASQTKALLEFVRLAQEWLTWQRVKPRIIAFAPAYTEQTVERYVEFSIWDNPKPKKQEFTRTLLSHRAETIIEQKYTQVGYDLVIGAPPTIDLSLDIDWKRFLQMPRREKSFTSRKPGHTNPSKQAQCA